MRILVLSDLHIERKSFSAKRAGGRVDDEVEVVVLAGDIHEGVKGLRWARETAPQFDIDFLETNAVDIGGVRFLGCSLWTDFELFGPERKSEVLRETRSIMGDYKWIRITVTPELYSLHSKKLVPELEIRRHQDSVEWLKQEMNKGEPAKTVVVAHHAPHPQSIPEDLATDPVSAAYASDLSRLMGKATLWIHGHIHSSADYLLDNTRVVCNPRGRGHRNGKFENALFNSALVIEV